MAYRLSNDQNSYVDDEVVHALATEAAEVSDPSDDEGCHETNRD